MTRHDFFIGWAGEMPADLAATTRRRAIGLLLVGVAIALVLAAAQRPFASAATFEFGETTSLIGVCELEPVPTLVVARPGSRTASRYLLTVFGKRGANDLAQPFDGQWVRLDGTLVHRGRETMVEIAGPTSIRALTPAEAESSAAAGASTEVSEPLDLGFFDLEGEIVDSKCFLGVMKPGNLKLHRACATRCISGGVPPLFLLGYGGSSETAGNLQLLLTDENGGAVNSRILDHIAEPLRIRGRVLRQGDRLILRADPATYERLAP